MFEFLEAVRDHHRYPKKPKLYLPESWDEIGGDELALWEEAFTLARSFCPIAVEVHLGLDAEQERQLFHDLNNLGKKVATSLALEFDRSNPVNQFITEELLQDIADEWELAEKDTVDWDNDTGAISRKDLVAVNALLFLNKTNISGATPPQADESATSPAGSGR